MNDVGTYNPSFSSAFHTQPLGASLLISRDANNGVYSPADSIMSSKLLPDPSITTMMMGVDVYAYAQTYEA